MRKICSASLVLIVMLVSGQCQEPPKRSIEVKSIFGWAGFPDETTLHHFVVGTSARSYLTRRLSFEPELLYMRGPGFDRDILLVPNLALDLGSSPKVRPYLMGGAGLLLHRDGIRAAPERVNFFWGKSWTLGVGLGVKVFVNDSLFISPEVRFGWEPFVRSTVNIGYRF